VAGDPEPWGVYVHVPWCRVRCPYCAFHVDRDDGAVPWDRFAEQVRAAIASQRELFPGDPHTVFLGGGTPSRLPATALRTILADLGRPAETTIETNPEDVSEAWLRAVTEAGVDRVSLGVQTFDAGHARRLGRAHTPPEARAAVALVADAHRAGRLRSWSADLMFALPGQTVDDLDADLDVLLAAGAPHVSVYGLTWEPGTPFRRALDEGRLAATDDDRWADLAEHLVARLEAAGRVRHEVSNFAIPGHESQHNTLYWTDRPYLGVGPSAHGYLPDGRRTIDVADTARWLAGGPGIRTVETPTPREAAADHLVGGLRGRDGVDLVRLAARTGAVPDPGRVNELVARGLLARAGSRVALTRHGYALADGVTAALVAALVDAPPPSE
jgi:oxygen-independent coproporphyrinogen-3 oxidase